MGLVVGNGTVTRREEGGMGASQPVDAWGVKCGRSSTTPFQRPDWLCSICDALRYGQPDRYGWSIADAYQTPRFHVESSVVVLGLGPLKETSGEVRVKLTLSTRPKS